MCRECAKAIIQKGIKEVWCIKTDDIETRKKEFHFEEAVAMLNEAGVKLHIVDLKELALHDHS